MDNHTIAQKLREYAAQLAREQESLYRVRAYRQAVLTIQSLSRPLAELVAEEGRRGLEALPGIGRSLAYTIEGLVRTGEFRTRRERRCA
jgi:DNA polymerase/3'-5' exonuclease PolX